MTNSSNILPYATAFQAFPTSFSRTTPGDVGFKLNTHRRRRRDETVELRRVGGVNTPVGSRDPVYNFLCSQVTT